MSVACEAALRAGEDSSSVPLSREMAQRMLPREFHAAGRQGREGEPMSRAARYLVEPATGVSETEGRCLLWFSP
jgi:hypothetical protein